MRALAAIVILFLGDSASAQSADTVMAGLPPWMLAAFPGRTPPPASATWAFEHYNTGLLVPHRFHGRFSMKGHWKERGPDLTVNGWSDSTRACLLMDQNDVRITMLVDLPGNIAVLAVKGDTARATVRPLREYLLASKYLEVLPSALELEERIHATGRTRTVLGEACEEVMHIEGLDTLWCWRSSKALPSPFADLMHWVPLQTGTPALQMHEAGRLGDPLPMAFTYMGVTLEMTSIEQGEFPPPTLDLSSYRVKDFRKRTDNVVIDPEDPDGYYARKYAAIPPLPEHVVQAAMEPTNRFRGHLRFRCTRERDGKIKSDDLVDYWSNADSILIIEVRAEDKRFRDAMLMTRSNSIFINYHWSDTIFTVSTDSPTRPELEKDECLAAPVLPTEMRRMQFGHGVVLKKSMCDEDRSVWICADLPSYYLDIFGARHDVGRNMKGLLRGRDMITSDPGMALETVLVKNGTRITVRVEAIEQGPVDPAVFNVTRDR